MKIAANGRVCIPADVRARLGVKDGDSLLLEESDAGLTLRTTGQAVREVQATFKRMMKDSPAFSVDNFLREKRRQLRDDESHDRELYGE